MRGSISKGFLQQAGEDKLRWAKVRYSERASLREAEAREYRLALQEIEAELRRRG